jgi:AAA family ATP:ADP antiporter
VLAVRHGERTFTAAMFAYFFLVIATFWVLKPLKKALFIGFYEQAGMTFAGWHLAAPQGELLAKVLNMVVAFMSTVVFTQLSRTLRRQRLTYVFAGFSLICLLLYARLVVHPDAATVWSFYLFGDLFNTLMVATFFAFLNDSVLPDDAKRLYGPIVFGGVAGGVCGSSVVARWIELVSTPAWLCICGAATLAVALVAALAGRTAPHREHVHAETPAERKSREDDGNAAIEGARLVWRSSYLLAIVGIVGCYEISSTLLDFMFTSTVVHYRSGPEVGAYFARVFSITNWASMLVQLLVTSPVMTRLGLGVALAVQPGAMAAAATAFLAAPTLLSGSLLNTADNAFSYSLNQSAKEALYVPTSPREKYGAKAFIDMFVQRFAKVLGVVASLGITTAFTDFGTVRWLSLVVLAFSATWLGAVRVASRQFAQRAARLSPPRAPR